MISATTCEGIMSSDAQEGGTSRRVALDGRVEGAGMKLGCGVELEKMLCHHFDFRGP